MIRSHRFRAATVAAALLVTGCANQQAVGPGLVDGRLTPCSRAPNCVTSEYPAVIRSWVAPIDVADYQPVTVWPAVVAAVDAMGGVVLRNDGQYLSATFMSDVMKFVDDLECRYDDHRGVIHVRSASRFGWYDFDVNRVRVEQLRRRVIERLRRPR